MSFRRLPATWNFIREAFPQPRSQDPLLPGDGKEKIMGTKLKFPVFFINSLMFGKYWKILDRSQQTTYKKQLLTSAFDFTAVFADKVVSISEAAQRAERLARLAGSVVVKRLIGTLHHARWDSVPNWIPDLFANVVGLERNWKKKIDGNIEHNELWTLSRFRSLHQSFRTGIILLLNSLKRLHLACLANWPIQIIFVRPKVLMFQ